MAGRFTLIIADIFLLSSYTNKSSRNNSNRSQVQGSTFRVKEKEGIEDPKALLKRLIFPSNFQFGSKLWITPEEADAFLVNMHPKCSPGTRMEL